MKKVLVGGMMLLALIGGRLNASPVGFSEAKAIAQDFYLGQHRSQAKGLPEFDCVYPSLNTKGGNTPYYIFNVGDNQGFVIVSGDDNTRYSVLGYADRGRFEMENMPQNVRSWLAFYEEGVRYASQSPKRAVKDTIEHEAVVEPLLGTISYNQSAPYNNMCPIDTNSGATTYTGCVATALASIAKYYEYPSQGKGTVDYITDALKIHVTGDLSQSHYDWENILPSYGSDSIEYTEAQKDAIALLMRDFGYAVTMQYTPSASGATTDNIIRGVVDHMGFDSLTSVRRRENFDTQEEWEDMLRFGIDQGCPMYYQGYGEGGGHAFVCDGYDNKGYFHINWGWGGFCDGYFLVYIMDPGSIDGIGAGTGGGYAQGQEVLFNLVPQGESLSDDYFLTTSESISTNPRLAEDSTYDFSKTFLVHMGTLTNYTRASFEGYLGVALYTRDGEFVSLISDSIPEGGLAYNQSVYSDSSVTVKFENVADGEYAMWKVCRSKEAGSAWNRMYSSRKSVSELSCMYITVADGKYVVEPVAVDLTINIDNPIDRRPTMEVWKDGLLLATLNIDPLYQVQSLVKGVYDLNFYMRGFDTTYVHGLTVQNDTTISIKMNQIIEDPYIRFFRLKYNNLNMTWLPCDPRDEIALYPDQYVLFMDSKVVDTVDADVTEYDFTNLSLGLHEAGLQSIYPGGVSNIVTREFEVKELAGNEEMESLNFALVPNPSVDGRFRLTSDVSAEYSLFNSMGQVLKQDLIQAGSNELDLSGYDGGYYYLRITAGNQVEVLKVVKL